MKKRLLFAAYSLDIGGIEKALITLSNALVEKGYNITIVLEKKQGRLLNELNEKVKVIEYPISYNKILFIKKIKNLLTRIIFSLKYRNKFDFAASYATYSIPSSVVCRIASKNTALWCHADYLTLFNNDEKKVIEFFSNIKIKKFKNIVFVSEEGKNSFLRIFPEMESRTISCNNLIDYKKIRGQAEEEINDIKENDCVIFLNVGRQDEKQKRLTRLIEACKKLNDENYKFEVLLIGDGKDTEMYMELVNKEKLESKIKFLGAKENPYPYFKISDCVVLTSEYEGYPVVFLESFVLNKPIITTKVSDYKEVEKWYGLVAEKNSEDIYAKMKQFIENGYKIKHEFNAEEYNEKIINKIEKIF